MDKIATFFIYGKDETEVENVYQRAFLFNRGMEIISIKEIRNFQIYEH